MLKSINSSYTNIISIIRLRKSIILTFFVIWDNISKHLKGMKRVKNNKKLQLVVGTLVLGMFLSGCQKEIAFVIKRDNSEHTNKDFTTSSVEQINEDTTESQSIESTIIPTEITIPTSTQLPETFFPPLSTEEKFTPTEHQNIETEPTPSEETPSSETIISETEITVEETEPTKEELPENIIAYTTTNVNLRAGNNTNTLIISQLQPNTCVHKIKSYDNNWDLVSYNGQIGFMCRDYLLYTEEKYEKEHNFIFKDNNDIVVTTTELNFRSGPSTDYEIKKTEVTTEENVISEIEMVFKKNEELKVIAEVDDEWLLVEYNGEFGYVHKAYTISLLEKLQATYPELGIERFDIPKVVYSNSGLNIRAGNSTDYAKIGSLEWPESARVFGEYDGWYLIMTNEHEFGFIYKENVTELDGKTTIIDKSEQRMYMYTADEMNIYTPVTTGKDSTETDTGIFAIHYMDTDIYLNGTKDWVNFWLNYNGNNEGIHDAWWRKVYGEENYHWNGSNGCNNTPYAAVKTMYYNSELGQKVIVHR